jgi:propionate CoA-transferase
MKIAYTEDRLTIVTEGDTKKFVNRLDQISFNGDIATEENRKVLYVTERCVFQLIPDGLQLIEIAPGISIERDILAHMEFKPQIADNLKVMDRNLFRI